MWDLRRPGLEPLSPALAGRFSTTVPPGKPLHWVFVAVHRLSSSCGERGLLFVAVRGLLIAVASLVAEHGLYARGLQ